MPGLSQEVGMMPEFRVNFLQPKFVNVEAKDEEEAKKIVLDGEWEYGMDGDNGDRIIESVEVI
jgi:hypothetical protein